MEKRGSMLFWLFLELVQRRLEVWRQGRLVGKALHPLLPVLPHSLEEVRLREEVEDRGRHDLGGEDSGLMGNARAPDGCVLPGVTGHPDDEVGGAQLLGWQIPSDVCDVR